MTGRVTQQGRRRRHALDGRRVNLLLGVLVALAVATGLAGFALPDRWNGTAVTAHGVVGVALVLLARPKRRGPVRAGLARGRRTRWVSIGFGVVVLGAFVLGVLHATGTWHGVGAWSALWTHELLGFAAVPLLLWHVVSRPVRPRAADLDRRAALRTGLVLGGAAVLLAGQEAAARVLRLDGAERRHTGSHELASHDPDRLPAVIWLLDRVPADTDPAGWDLRVAGRPVPVAQLWARARPVVARLDCTGGWWSEQAWDAVPLGELLVPTGRSVRVTSVTGHARRVPSDALGEVHLAVGYGGVPLRPGHGAPVRLVVPGRRGPWWVKWVATVDDDARPAWLELPLPV